MAKLRLEFRSTSIAHEFVAMTSGFIKAYPQSIFSVLSVGVIDDQISVAQPRHWDF